MGFYISYQIPSDTSQLCGFLRKVRRWRKVGRTKGLVWLILLQLLPPSTTATPYYPFWGRSAVQAGAIGRNDQDASNRFRYSYSNYNSFLDSSRNRQVPVDSGPTANHITEVDDPFNLNNLNLPESSLNNLHYLTPADFERASRAPSVDPNAPDLEAMLLPNLFEGDIKGVVSDFGVLHDAADILSQPQNSALNLGTYPDKLWAEGKIPYKLEEGLSETERVAVAQAFEEYKNKTCIRFLPKRDADVDFIVVRKNYDSGCSSYVGKAGGNQTVSLEMGKCFTKGIIAHELMHSLGFFHEHSRTDRDKYVLINEENVKPGMLRNFEKYPQKIIDTLAMPYDYGSVMHYHKLAFSKNGKATIEPITGDTPIGQRYQLSEIDASKVNKLYKCHESPEWTTTTGGTTVGSSTSSSSTVAPTKSVSETTTPATTTGATSSATTATTASLRTNECKNQNEHCDMWADTGHCRWSEKYMSHYCKKACSLCSEVSRTKPTTTDEPIAGCVDKNLFCGYWARIGECDTDSKFMKIFCRKSCNYCA